MRKSIQMNNKKTYTFEEAKQETGLFRSLGDGSCKVDEEEVFIFIPADKNSDFPNIGLYYRDGEITVLEECVWKQDVFIKADCVLNICFSNQ